MADNREFTDLHPAFPDAKKVRCRDCKYRDKTEVDLFGKHYTPGVTRSTCQVFDGNPAYKPDEVLFENANCEYYEAE